MNQGTSTDAVNQHIIEALARRAASHEGLVRQVLLQRLAQWQAQHAATNATPTPAMRVADEQAARRQPLAGLSALVDRLGRLPAPAPAAASVATAHPPLRSVTAFKDTWSRLRAEQRLRQALAGVPAQAGPLNSSQVVHRALQTLHDLSPAYLDAFIAHIDTLLALDDASGGHDRSARATPAARRNRR